MTQSVVIAANSNPNDFKLIAYEASAPNTAVDDVLISLPHTVDQTATFLSLNDVAHIFRLYEWNGSSLGALLSDVLVQPKQVSIDTPPDIHLIVGTDLTIDADTWDGSILYPDYFGYVLFQDYRVEQRGVGVLRDDEVQNSGDFGFQLINGAIFNEADTFIIHFIPKLKVSPTNTSTTNNSGFKDIIELANSTTLDTATYLNVLIDINHTADTVAPTFTLPAIAAWTDMSSIGFITHKGSQVNAIVAAASGETIYFNGASVNDIVMGRGETLKITKKGTAIYVEHSTVNYSDVGKVENGIFVEQNNIIGEGQLIARNIYVRLWRKVQQLTSGNGVVTDTVWGTSAPANQFNYSYGDGSTTFRVPNYRGVSIRFLDGGRGLDTERIAASKDDVIGSFQADGVKTLSVSIPRVGYAGIGGTGNKFVGTAGSPDAGNQSIAITGQTETTIKNVGLLPLIKI